MPAQSASVRSTTSAGTRQPPQVRPPRHTGTPGTGRTRSALAALLSAAAVSAIGTAPAPLRAETTILFNSFIQPQHPANTRVLKPWAEEITKATHGRVRFDIPPSSLAAPAQQLDGVVKGVFDMAYQFNGLLVPKVKLTQIAHLPGVNGSAKGSSIALWRTYEKFFRQADEYKDVHLLGLWVAGGGTIFGMKTPIQTIADVKGVKIYGLPGVAAKVLEDAGAGVVAAPAVRSHEIVSGGTVDAFAGYALMDANAFKTLQYAKYVTDLPGHLTAPSFALFVNKKKWASLSAEDREVITKLSGEALAARFAAFDEIETKLRTEAAAGGIRIVPASAAFAADVQRISQPLVQSWLADAKSLGVDGQAALDYFRQQAADASK